jgi:Tol biopolymer transport system component
VASAEIAARATSSAEYLISEIKRHRRGFSLLMLALALAIVGGRLVFIPTLSGRQPSSLSSTAASEIIPFTSFSGSEGMPSFAPDGNRVAFSWNGEDGQNVDVYVKQVGTEDLQRLTHRCGSDISPRWSPNGPLRCVSAQNSDSYSVILVPSIGGKERELTKLALVPPMRFDIAQISWFPDSEWLAVSDRTTAQAPFSISMISRESGRARPLTKSAAGSHRGFDSRCVPGWKDSCLQTLREWRCQ